jgi:nucleoside-diphosphate-sugar epimerase
LTFIENALACRPLEVWGDGRGGRDIVYVKDVVAAFIKALNSDRAAGLYNIASGKLLTVREEAETIARVFWGDNSPPVIIERPDIPLRLESFSYDIGKAGRDLGWTPEYDFEAMLRDYKMEMTSGRFDHLVEKRRMMMNTRSA